MAQSHDKSRGPNATASGNNTSRQGESVDKQGDRFLKFLKACQSEKILFEFDSTDASKGNINRFIRNLDKLATDFGAASSSEKVRVVAHLMDNAAQPLHRTRANDRMGWEEVKEILRDNLLSRIRRRLFMR